MATIKLTVEYEGTAYAGWQQQPNRPTVQGQLETAQFQISRQRIAIIGAGRTDAGVHAWEQVASFRTPHPLSPQKWAPALNRYLPRDIVILQSEQVPDDFHARYSARKKIYEYRISLHRNRPALDRNRVWHVHYPIDPARIREAIPWLTGTHDFTSFEGPRSGTTNRMCTISNLSVNEDGNLLIIRIEADRFLKQMVRTIIGTLIEVGRQRRDPSDLPTILEAKDRRAAGETAPPHGLYLLRVLY
jgi:tRNA pseudouridine38-40 synthase